MSNGNGRKSSSSSDVVHSKHAEDDAAALKLAKLDELKRNVIVLLETKTLALETLSNLIVLEDDDDDDPSNCSDGDEEEEEDFDEVEMVEVNSSTTADVEMDATTDDGLAVSRFIIFH
jgi:hypothetical protein